ncbi:thiolase family protein [Rhodococcus koreensis]
MSPLASIVGVGELQPQRTTTDETTLGQIAYAAKLALDDAGLTPDAIDGLLITPQPGETPEHAPITVAEYLGLRPHMANMVDLGGASAAGMAWRAAAAINLGMCDTVLCVAGNIRPADGTEGRAKNRNPIREFEPPMGASGANIAYAMIAQAHMDAYGTTADSLAEIAVRHRDNAQLNPSAIFYGKPTTVNDVLDSPMIAAPIHMFEAVMEVAGGSAFIVTSADRARSFPHDPVDLIGAGEHHTHRALSQAPSLTSGPLKVAMHRALTAARVDPTELSLLALYDCYTIVVGVTLEDLGLCPPGAFGKWIMDHDISHRGDMPLNTHGGQLGFGQPSFGGAFTQITEAVRQLRGQGGPRQITNPTTALVTGNGATLGEAASIVLERRS